MSEKPVEYYIALASAMLVVAMQHKEKPWLARTAIAGSSGGLGYGLANELSANIAWMGDATAIAIITAFSYAALDAALAILADREAIVAAARKWIGGGK